MKTQVAINDTRQPSLTRAVIRQLGGRESLEDVANHGADSGFSGFTYYSETEPFAQRHREAILERLSEDAQELGYDSTLAMVRSFRCLKGETITDGDLMRALCRGKNPVDGPNLLNALAWYTLEEIARELNPDL